MDIGDIKEKIVIELETSKEPVYAGTIAIKYKIPYLQVEKALKELKRDGIIE